MSELIGTALRDREGNVYFIEAEALASMKVQDPETAAALSQRIDEEAEVSGFAAGALNYTGVSLQVSSPTAAWSTPIGINQVQRWQSRDLSVGVLLW